jgi:N-acetylglucosamine-6-phosphate deacetylase
VRTQLRVSVMAQVVARAVRANRKAATVCLSCCAVRWWPWATVRRVVDAIRAATTGAARLLGLGSSIGRLVRGYAAGAVVVGDSPLDKIAVLEQPHLVVAGGAVVTG